MPSKRLLPQVRTLLAREIARAGGREVCFVGVVDESGVVTEARPVAGGPGVEVLALPGAAGRGEMVIHNPPGGDLEPSVADLNVAARLHDGGVGFAIINNAASERSVVLEGTRGRSSERPGPPR